jgi:DNA transformation protein
MDPEFIRELFAEFGPVAVRRMFGGAGLYADGVMFGLVAGGLIYLKTDAATVPAFEREGCGPFEYGTKTGKRAIISYWRLPDRLYDDADELARWARQALAVVQQAAPKRVERRAPRRKKAKKRKR